MKQLKLFTTLFLLGIGQVCFAARPSYHIHLKVTDARDTAYLLHYYGKGRPTLFKIDSAAIDKSGNAEFVGKDTDFVGGIYIVYLPKLKNAGAANDTTKPKAADFEFLLNKYDDISITADVKQLPEGIKFKNSPENERFAGYVSFLSDYAKMQKKFETELKSAKTAADTAEVRKEAIAYAKKLTNYRREYVKSNPHTLLSAIFNAMETPEVPEGPHYLEDGKTKDSTFTYRYYKTHYWDGFDFHDDRLIYTPLYDAKIDEYMTRLVVPWPDSVKYESDMLLNKAKGSRDVFHYTLWWLTRYTENSKVMGMDEAFVYLIENYYMKGYAFWLKPDELEKFEKRARDIAPNVIGNLAPEIKVPNVTTKKEESLHALKGKYTLVIFYSPNCGHCQHEMPSIDSLYREVLKPKGVKIFTLATEGDEKQINDFIKKYNMGEWTNTWNPDHTSDYHSKYDVYSTPTIYLLDEKKLIVGKRLDHSNIAGVIDMVERKAKDKAKEKGAAKAKQ